MAGVKENKQSDRPADENASRDWSLDLPSLKVVQRYGIFSQDRLPPRGAILADPTANLREHVNQDDLSGFASSLRGDLSPKDSVSRSEVLLQKRRPSYPGCALLERPSNIRQHLPRDGYSDKETELPESSIFDRSPASAGMTHPDEGGLSRPASARPNMLLPSTYTFALVKRFTEMDMSMRGI